MPNIFLGGWMLIIASILKPHWEFHIKGEGLRVGRGDILILGLWTRDRIISANLGPERLLSSLASSQPFFFFPPACIFYLYPDLVYFPYLLLLLHSREEKYTCYGQDLLANTEAKTNV